MFRNNPLNLLKKCHQQSSSWLPLTRPKQLGLTSNQFRYVNMVGIDCMLGSWLNFG